MTEDLPDERPQRRREYSSASSTLGLAALIVITVGAALWFFEFRDKGSSGGGAPGMGIVALPAALNPTGKAPAAEEGRAAPDFKLSTADGSVVQLSGFRGQYVAVNFWATWCGPCRAETPGLQSLHQSASGGVGGPGLTVIGLNQQEQPDTVRGFAAEFGVTYPLALDSSGEVSGIYRVSGGGLPVTFLVNPAGVIEKIFTGRITPEALAAATKAGP